MLVRHTYISGWYLPGGGVNKGESAQAALARELREELLLEISSIERTIGLYHSRREFKDDHVGVFVVRPVSAPDPLSIGDPGEIAEAGWFAPETLPDDTSPATVRRVAEYLGRRPVSAEW